MKRRSASAGFTLIEMMVVVAIIAILSGLVISASSKPVGASAKNSAEQIVGIINFAKLRAQSTRRIHEVRIEPNRVAVWASPTTGLAMPGTGTWTLIQQLTIPKGVTIYDVDAAAQPNATGTSVTPNGSLLYALDVRPDGEATASTVYVADNTHKWRVIVYHITGGTYAREFW